MRHPYLTAALCILALFALAMLWAVQQRYYPKVEIAFPDRSELIFADMPWSSEKKCSEANARVSGAIGGNCPQCKIVSSCDRQIPDELKKALSGEAIGAYVVHSGTLRILVRAGEASEQTCLATARQIQQGQGQQARCVSPK